MQTIEWLNRRIRTNITEKRDLRKDYGKINASDTHPFLEKMRQRRILENKYEKLSAEISLCQLIRRKIQKGELV